MSLSLIFFMSNLLANGNSLLSTSQLVNPETSQITGQFQNWDLVLHFGATDSSILDSVLQDTYNSMTLFKYNSSINAATFRRPLVNQCVNVIVDLEDEFLNYTNFQNNIQEKDVVILFLEGDLDLDYNQLWQTGLDNSNVVFYLNKTMALAVSFYVDRDANVRVEVVTRDKENIPELYKYQNNFKNFYGFPLQVGYTNCVPFMYDMDDFIAGVEFKILEIIANSINATLVMKNYSGKYKNPRSALIKDVNQSKLHIGTGCLSNNFIRNQMVAFSNELQTEPHITLYAANRYNYVDWFIIFIPFEIQVWILSICTLLIFIIGVKVISKVTNARISSNYALVPIGIILEQPVLIPSYINIRLGLSSWILIGFALSSSYKSKLTSAIIKPTTHEPKFLKDLYKQNYHFISPAEDSTFLMELLQLSSNPVEYNIGKALEDTKDVCDAINRTFKEVTAVVEERTVLRYKLWNECNKHMTLQEVISLRRLQGETIVSGHSWALPKSAPYKKRISMLLEVIKSHGFVEKWYTSHNISRPLIISNSIIPPNNPIHVKELTSAWLILFIGYTLAVIAFIYESCIDNARNFNFNLV